MQEHAKNSRISKYLPSQNTPTLKFCLEKLPHEPILAQWCSVLLSLTISVWYTQAGNSHVAQNPPIRMPFIDIQYCCTHLRATLIPRGGCSSESSVTSIWLHKHRHIAWWWNLYLHWLSINTSTGFSSTSSSTSPRPPVPHQSSIPLKNPSQSCSSNLLLL